MTPDYIRALAEAADPDQLWRRSGLDQEHLSAAQRKQLDTGVALRRHAEHVARLQSLRGTGHSLLLTPLQGCTDVCSVPTPSSVTRRVSAENPVTRPVRTGKKS